MSDQGKDLLYAFIVAILVFLVLAGLLARLIFLHYEKVKRMKLEKDVLKAQYDQELLQAQLEVEEQTRKNIAQELHDNLGALSSLIKINLNLAAVAQEPNEKERLLFESKNLLKDLIVELKQLSVSLNADRLSQYSLSEMIQLEVDRLQKLGLFSIHYNEEGEEAVLSADHQVMVFRICQEILHNVVKHANASRVDVRVKYSPAYINVQIMDDGVGFNPQENQSKELGGSGLINIKNRARLIGSSLVIESIVGKGTRCELKLPLTKKSDR
jgi:signal transduction histidine kinase